MDFLIFVVNFLFSVVYVLLIIRALLPWFVRVNKASLVYNLTEPFLRIIRMGLPPLRIGMDVSPFVVMILLWVLQKIILGLLAMI